jgi:hypothetical protein
VIGPKLDKHGIAFPKFAELQAGWTSRCETLRYSFPGVDPNSHSLLLRAQHTE